MTCSEFDLLIVSDEPEAAAALRKHASGCPRCAEILAGQAELLQNVEAWKESTPAPPPELEVRVLQAAAQQTAAQQAAAQRAAARQAAAQQTVARQVAARQAAAQQTVARQVAARQAAAQRAAAQQLRQPGREEVPEKERISPAEPGQTRGPGRLLRFPRRHPYAWGAIAATLILAFLLVARTGPWAQAPREATRLLVAEALKDAVRAEREHARAIARLEQAAAPILARSEDTRLTASKAAVLIAYRDRLAYLDTTIAEIEGFLDNNPSHSGGRTVLLAAYTEKTEVLSQVIALEEEWAS